MQILRIAVPKNATFPASSGEWCLRASCNTYLSRPVSDGFMTSGERTNVSQVLFPQINAA
jgi:hypothetical protein